MKNYKTIFKLTEDALRKHSFFTRKQFDEVYGEHKHYSKKRFTDKKIYQLLTMIVFFSGFKASTVEKKESIILGHFPDPNTVSKYSKTDFNRILKDENMIRNKAKIQACISNAKTMKKLSNEYGSFQKYLNSFKADKSFENLSRLKKTIQNQFSFLGDITVYHFLTDLGFSVIKPDRVLMRIFKRLGFIENDKQFLETVLHGRKFAESTGHPIRYIDIIFVKYGQLGKSEKFGIDDGICLELNPKCSACKLHKHCNYYTG